MNHLIFEDWGKMKINQKQNNDAQKHFQQAIRLNPKTWQSYFWLSLLAILDNNDDLAVNYLEKSLVNGLGDKKLIDSQPPFKSLENLHKYQDLLKKYF